MPSVTGGWAPAKPRAARGSQAVLHPATLEVMAGISASASVAGNRFAAAVPGTGKLPFPSLGHLEQQHGSHSPVPYFGFASCCSPGGLTRLCSSPGLSRAEKLNLMVLLRNLAEKPLGDFMCSQSQAPETKCARWKKVLPYFCFLLKKLAGN